MDANLLALRRKFITGSDIGAIIGVNPFRTPLDVYAAKMGLTDEQPDNESMYWGRELEAPIAARYAADHGVKLIKPGFLVHPTRRYWAGDPDRRVEHDPVGLEIKTVGARSRFLWGAPGTDEIPESYLAQGHWYIPLLDVERMDFPVLFAGQEYAEYVIYRDLEFEGLLAEAAERFIRDHLQKQEPPAMTEPSSAERYLRAKYPRNTGPVVQVEGRDALVLAGLRKAKVLLSVAEREYAMQEAKVKAIIGNNSGIEHPEYGRVTWKLSKGRSRIDAKALAAEHPEIARKFTVRGPDYRKIHTPSEWVAGTDDDDNEGGDNE